MPSVRKSIVHGTGQRLEKVRNILGYTRNTMAQKLGLQQITYYKNETGLSVPGFKSLLFLQRDYDISIDWLLFEKGPMYFSQKQNVPVNEVQGVKPISAIEALVPDVKELLESMENDPLFRHEVMLNFYKYKKKAVHSDENASETNVTAASD